MKSFKIKNISKVDDYKIELGIPLLLTVGGWSFIGILMATGLLTFHGLVEATKGNFTTKFCVYFFTPAISFMLCFLPSLFLFSIFGSHEFYILRHGELMHRIFMFNIKIIERKYENITRVDVRKGCTTVYNVDAKWYEGRKTTHTTPDEVYIVVNQPRVKSVRLVTSFKPGMLDPLCELLQNEFNVKPVIQNNKIEVPHSTWA